MPIRSFDARIVHTGDDCSIIFPNDTYVYRELKAAFSDGDKVTIEVKSRRKPRSLAQNNYLHMALQMIADETGNSLQAVKTTLKLMYAKVPLLDREGEPVYNKDTGEQAFYVQDTRDMSTVQAMAFADNVRVFAMDFCNLIIPLPSEQIDMNIK